ncbi:protein kinase domain-containing protein [Actinoallomurus sp. CA-142502]|uniref:WD40 repeat domain-containing serine/threonine protein kinase n=1 Tax=Actinoallomurus sp. CA-142502 TaxID=3239885 RepID=UPI003D8F6C99
MPDPLLLRPGDPETIGSYDLTGFLGEGGQGAVYLAENADGDRVAVKVLHARFAGDDRALRRFVREVDATRRVARFCTARVLEVAVSGTQPYIVSEYVPGESLKELIARDGPREVGALERLAVNTAAALAAIHRAGIVHRDVKPSNVLMGPDGPRVIDFGIARALDHVTTQSTGLIGTPAYMSPEQIAGGGIGPASDMFSWALTLVYAAVGRPAFGGDSVPAVMHRILTGQPDLSGVPTPLRDLIAAALAKDPEQRPTANDVLPALAGPPTAQRPVVLGPPKDDAPFAAVRSDASSEPAVAPPDEVTHEPTVQVSDDQTGEPTLTAPGHHTPEPTSMPPDDAILTPGVMAPRDAAPEQGVMAPRDTTPGPGVMAPREIAVTSERRPMTRRKVLLTAVGGLAGVTVPTGLYYRLHDRHGTASHLELAAVLRGHSAEVRGVDFGPDGRFLVSGGRDGIRIWNVATQSGVATLALNVAVTSVAFSPDGRILAAGTESHRVELWNTSTGRLTATLEGHSSPVGCVAFSPNGKMLASGGGDGTIRLWDPVERHHIATLTGHTAVVGSAAFSPDGKTLATNGSNRVWLWNPAKRRRVAALSDYGASVNAVAFSPDSKILATGDGDRTARLWDVGRRRVVATLTGHTGALSAVAFSRNGGFLATGGTDRTVRVWEMAGRRAIATLTGHTGYVEGVAFSPDYTLASCSDDKTVRLWTFR